MVNLMFSLGEVDVWLLGGMGLVWLYQCYFWFHYMAQPWIKKKLTSYQASEQNPCPGVSVIVCARNEQENIQNYLPCLLTQDYPNYEVIVVDDESEDDTRSVVKTYAQHCPFLYCTFVPKEANVPSGKKMAITLGVKAAKYDYLLLIDADCRPESRYWIREMMHGFSAHPQQTEVVMGVGNYFHKDSWLNAIIQYDTLFTSLQYCGMSMQGHPYMGVGRNLAYRRDTFFRHNGFSGLLQYVSGDDDLFINKVATSTNTAVVCTRESLTWSVAKGTWKEWWHQKCRHISVSSGYKRSNRWRLGWEPLTRGILYGLLIAIWIWGSPIAKCAGIACWMIRLFWQTIILNVSAHRLGLQRIGLEMIGYEIMLPLISLWMVMTTSMHPPHAKW